MGGDGGPGADTVMYGEPPGGRVKSVFLRDPEGNYVQLDQRVSLVSLVVSPVVSSAARAGTSSASALAKGLDMERFGDTRTGAR